MVRAFTGEPLGPGLTEQLLRAANRAPSAGFSQGYSFLVLEGPEQSEPLWAILYEAAARAGDRVADERTQVAALSRAPLVIVPLACKDVYLDRYARPGKGWTDRDEARWPVPYWYIDTGFTALLILLAVVDEGLGAVFFGIEPASMADFRARFGSRRSGRRSGPSRSGIPTRRPIRSHPPAPATASPWPNWSTAAAGNTR